MKSNDCGRSKTDRLEAAQPLVTQLAKQSHVRHALHVDSNQSKKRLEALKTRIFSYIWPLAGPNIAKMGLGRCETGGCASPTARGDRQTHFGTFNFWVKPGF